MPRNGEINNEFGIYESLCCGAEIVVPVGITFPHCAKHMNVLTEWQNVADKRKNSDVNINSKDKDASAA